MCARGFITAAALVLATAVGAFAQTREDESIRALIEDQVDAWNRGDIEAYMAGYWNSDNTVFVSGGERSRGYAQLLERYRKVYDTREKMGNLEFADLMIRPVSHTTAIATGIWRLHRMNDMPWGRFTLILEKKPEGWRITYDHTSAAHR